MACDIEKADDLDREIKASGFANEDLGEEDRKALESIVTSYSSLICNYSMNTT